MSLSEVEAMQLLAALLLLLISSQIIGGLFQSWKQPRVIGEILGGLCFGPTVLGAISPDMYQSLFGSANAAPKALAFVFWLGLLLLMFCSGLESPTVSDSKEWKTVGWLVTMGTVIPLALGWAAAYQFDWQAFWGPKGSHLTFGFILAMAIAVTSIPVISKIFFDLGMINTPFARIILTTAMIEDVMLWVLLSITLSLGSAGHTSLGEISYHVLITIGYFVFCLRFGHRLYDTISEATWNPFRTSATGVGAVLVLLATVLFAYAIGVNSIFGAFLAGRIVGNSQRIAPETRQQLMGFSFAFFIPLYFASVGVKLDLLRNFDVLTFLGLLLFACVVKLVAAGIGAKLAGQSQKTSVHLAVALNARGGPGIVLATIAFDAQLINSAFYAMLVLLSLTTSQMAGWWLQRVQRRSPDELLLQAH